MIRQTPLNDRRLSSNVGQLSAGYPTSYQAYSIPHQGQLGIAERSPLGLWVWPLSLAARLVTLDSFLEITRLDNFNSPGREDTANPQYNNRTLASIGSAVFILATGATEQTVQFIDDAREMDMAAIALVRTTPRLDRHGHHLTPPRPPHNHLILIVRDFVMQTLVLFKLFGVIAE